MNDSMIRAAAEILRTEREITPAFREDVAQLLERLRAERDMWNEDARRMSGCLIAINKAPTTIPASILRGVAYDAALNCITPDVAEHQILRRSALLIED